MKYLFFSAALLMGMDPQSIHAQFGGRATHGSQGGSRNFQVSMPQLRILIREVVTEVLRDSNRNFSENSVRTTEKTIDQLTTGVERRLALRAPFRIVRESAESGGLRGHEGRGSDRPRGVERKPWEREGFIKSNHEGNRRQLAENLRKQTERTGETALLHRPPVQTTLYYRPGSGSVTNGVIRPVDPPVLPVDPPVIQPVDPPVIQPVDPPVLVVDPVPQTLPPNVDPVPQTLPPNNGGGQVGIGGGPGPVPPSFPGGPIGVGMPAPEPRPAVEAPQPPTSEGGGGEGGMPPGYPGS